MKIKLSIVVLFCTTFWIAACSNGVMDDSGDQSSNSAERKNSLPSPEMPANAMTPGSGTSNPYPANAGAPNSAAASGDFMMQAAQSGLAEVELSRLALTNAQDPAVKKLAQMMVADHTKANDELKPLASQKGVTLPTDLDAAHQAEMQRLKDLKGTEFDSQYIKIMVEDHEKAVGLFQSQSQTGTDPDVKAWAAKTLPVLQSHLQVARGLQSKPS